MGRIRRLKLKGETTVFHVMSRTALPDFPMGDIENNYLLGLLAYSGESDHPFRSIPTTCSDLIRPLVPE